MQIITGTELKQNERFKVMFTRWYSYQRYDAFLLSCRLADILVSMANFYVMYTSLIQTNNKNKQISTKKMIQTMLS